MKCRFGDEVDKIQTILDYVGEVEGPYNDLEDEPYVVLLAYSERALPCGHFLGEGYSDPFFFKTVEEAEQFKTSREKMKGIISED